jgi:hypothetical protein
MISPPSTYQGQVYIDGKWVGCTHLCRSPQEAAKGASEYAKMIPDCQGCRVVDDQGNLIKMYWS